MNVTARLRPLATIRADLVVLGSCEGSGGSRRPGSGLDRGTQRAIAGLLDRGDFRGRSGEIVVLYPDRGRPRLLLVGLGPATALTAHVRPEDRVRSLVAGFQVHLGKPVDPLELAVVVASLARAAGGTIARS